MVFLSSAHSCSKLYFLRHGLAGQHGDPQYKDDSLRPLTEQGRKKMRRAAQGMQALGLTFDAILSSPYVRARQTAEIVAQTLRPQYTKIHFTDNLANAAPIKKLLKEAQIHFPKSKKILFVGHEPHLSQLVSCLLKCKNPLPVDFKKGGLCCLSMPQPLIHETAILNWLLTSKQLCLIKEK